ncbi:putative ribonuclease H-like domain-containing protein [Tanacetum coccineum]
MKWIFNPKTHGCSGEPAVAAEEGGHMMCLLRTVFVSELVEEEIVQQDDVVSEQVVKESSRKAEGRLKRKTSKARKDKDKRQKNQDDPEKLTLMEYVEVISDSEEVISVIPLAVKSSIVSWKSYCKEDVGYYEIHRADGSYKTYMFFSEMLNDFDREDLIVLYRLFNEKYASTRPGFDDLMLWGDMKIMFEPNDDDAVWKNHHSQELIEWKLYDSCGVHSLMLGEVSIHMLVEKKYPLPQDTLMRMLQWKLHVNYNVTEMAYELLRGGLLGINLHKLVLLVQEVIRIKQYFWVHDYALWEVIKNGNSWVSVLQTTYENDVSVTNMSVPTTTQEKTNKKNDVKDRSLLLMALPNEHQLTFSQYSDAKTMFAAIETRFGGNEATKKTQKILLKQQYENFSASSTESLNSIFNRLQKIMNKADIETMNIDDLYKNFKIVEQDVKKSVGASTGAQNMAFMTTSSTSSTNDVNTANTAYENPNGSNLLQQDLEQIYEDDLEAMDLKWQLSLLSMRANRYFRRTGKKIFINANDTAGYDKSKVECFNCHKMRHFARECRALRNQDGRFREQDNTRKQGNNKDTSSKAMLAIDGVSFDWSDMADEQCDDLIVKLNQTEFKAATYKRGLATVEEQLVTYRKNEVLFSEEVTVLKREVACKDYEISVLKTEFEKVNKKGLGYHVVPPPYPLIYNAPTKLDLSYSGLDKFKEPEFEGYGPKDSKLESNIGYAKKLDDSKENSDDSLVKEQVSEDTSSFAESPLNVEKETIFPVDKKIEFAKPKNHKKPVRKSVRPFYKKTTLTNYTVKTKAVNTARQYKASVNAFRENRVNAIKASACWVWRPTRPNGASLGKPQLDDTRFIDSGCSRHMTRNIAYLLDFKEFDRGYVTFRGGAHGGRITGKGTLKTDSLDF